TPETEDHAFLLGPDHEGRAVGEIDQVAPLYDFLHVRRTNGLPEFRHAIALPAGQRVDISVRAGGRRAGLQASSTATAVASPPPMQSDATPRLRPLPFKALIRVTRIRVPLAPIGWPRAVAPPWTLILSCGMPMSRIANIATQANASLTSHR